jgi:hypothetical protein
MAAKRRWLRPRHTLSGVQLEGADFTYNRMFFSGNAQVM